MENKYYIVRTDRAGVFFCKIKERRGSEIDIYEARRIHFWRGATECIGLAKFGTSNASSCRITAPHHLTVLGVIEIIECTPESVASLSKVAEWTV